jgi:hypothetical protein
VPPTRKLGTKLKTQHDAEGRRCEVAVEASNTAVEKGEGEKQDGKATEQEICGRNEVACQNGNRNAYR